MTGQKAYEVEVVVAASRDAVWRALTEPAEIRRWFGWDYDGLDEEIRFIFVDHADPVPPDRLRFDDDGTAPSTTIELDAEGERTRVRLVASGDERGDEFDEIEEGWRTFLEQLRHQLERHPGEERRTIRLTGEADAADVAAAIGAEAPGDEWRAGAYQWFLATPEDGGALVSVAAREPLDAGRRGPVGVTVSTFGLDDAAYAAARSVWEARWRGLASDPAVTP